MTEQMTEQMTEEDVRKSLEKAEDIEFVFDPMKKNLTTNTGSVPSETHIFFFAATCARPQCLVEM